MSMEWPTAGVNQVGEYLVSGRPFAKSGLSYNNGWADLLDKYDDVTAGDFIDFPFITKRVIVTNTGANSISISFASLNLEDATTVGDSAVKVSKNYFVLVQNDSFDMHVKIKRLFIAGKGGAGSGVNIRAELTHINDPYDLTQSAQDAADNGLGGLSGIAESVKAT